MGCCPSKCPGTTPGKEYAATTTEVAPMCPSSVSVNQAEPIVDDAVQDMLMDRGDGKPLDKSDDEEPVPEDDNEAVVLKLKAASVAQDVSAAAAERRPEEVVLVQSPPSPPPSPQRKSSRSADDIPISSTYHRVHSAEVAEQEAKRQEELRLEAEQREREVREYKASMQSA